METVPKNADPYITKVSVRRDPTIPPGTPAPMFLICICAERVPVDYPNGPDVACQCGAQWTARGYRR